MYPERNDLVFHVVADVRGAEPGNSGICAPVADDLFRRLAEFRIVGWNKADAPESKARRAPQGFVAGQLTERAVDPVQVLGDFLEHDNVTGEVGFLWRTEQVAENGEIERRDRRFSINRWLQCFGRTVEEKGEGACNGFLPSLTQDVRGHRPVRHAPEATHVQRGKERAGVA